MASQRITSTRGRAFFVDGKTSGDLVAGIIVRVVWFSIFAAAATLYFNRKDIKS